MFNTPTPYDEKLRKDRGVGLKGLRAVTRVTRGITVSRRPEIQEYNTSTFHYYKNRLPGGVDAIEILEHHFKALFMLLRQRIAGECLLTAFQINKAALEYMEELVDTLVGLEIIESFDDYFE
jgi:hypothetical protein